MSHGDPAIKCTCCNGTGWREGAEIDLIREDRPDYKCNGCRGTGMWYYPDPNDYDPMYGRR